MTIQQSTYKTLSILNFIAMATITSAGFLFSLSLSVSLVFVPLILLALLSFHGFLDLKQQKVKPSASIHSIYPCYSKIVNSFKKVA